MSQKIYKGGIIEESLEDISILSKFKIVETVVTDDENPADRWHIHNVEATEDQFEELSKVIKLRGWYAHFWSNNLYVIKNAKKPLFPDKNDNIYVIAVFRDKVFHFNYEDKASWQPAIDYGLSVGIPLEQLDFLIH